MLTSRTSTLLDTNQLEIQTSLINVGHGNHTRYHRVIKRRCLSSIIILSHQIDFKSADKNRDILKSYRSSQRKIENQTF